MTNLIVSLNTDTQDQPRGASGVVWTDVALANDFLIFTAGSDTVRDGQPIPSSFQLSQAGVVLSGLDILIAHYLLADISANQLKEVHLMGSQNKRYVMGFYFDGITTSEPVLEAWDNVNMTTVSLACLGSATPSSSWLRGITTTSGLPGEGWTGSRLAGSSDGHFLWLNDQNGALSGAATLYCNLFMQVPAAQTAGGAESPVLVVKYCTT